VPRSVALQDTPTFLHGKTPRGVTAKDLILAIIGKKPALQAATATSPNTAAKPFAPFPWMPQTVCNMTIEGGARAGMIAAG